jgi:hypothetical protein
MELESKHNMNIDVTQYRGSIGQHYTASRTPMTRKRLSYLDILCISLFAIHGLQVLHWCK